MLENDAVGAIRAAERVLGAQINFSVRATRPSFHGHASTVLQPFSVAQA